MRIYTFEEVIGNYSTVTMIRSAVTNRTYPQFSMMIGDSGTGKSTCAEIVSLSLTCEYPNNGNPCLSCESCRTGLLALTDKGTSMKIRKINLGKNNDKDDVKQLITDIFKLDTGTNTSVFILEECHSLSPSDQTSLLEEIDKLSSGVYVIMCTTKPRGMIEELRNRAIKFRFTHLKPADSKILFTKLVGGKKFPSHVESLILKHCKGVPRSMVNLVEFLKTQNASSQEIIDFLGAVNSEDLRSLLMSISDASSFYNYLNFLVSDYTVDTLIYALKEYLLELQYLNMGVGTVHASMSKLDKELAVSLGKDVLYKIQTIIHELKYDSSAEDFSFSMFKVRSIVLKHLRDTKQSTTKGDVVSNPTSMSMEDTDFSLPPSNASEAHVSAMSRRESYKMNVENGGKVLTPITETNLFGGGK